jgi:hypothetical protein
MGEYMLANEWTVGELDIIAYEGLVDGNLWRVALKGDPF